MLTVSQGLIADQHLVIAGACLSYVEMLRHKLTYVQYAALYRPVKGE